MLEELRHVDNQITNDREAWQWPNDDRLPQRAHGRDACQAVAAVDIYCVGPTHALAAGLPEAKRIVLCPGLQRLASVGGPEPRTIAVYAFETPNGRKISVALEEMGLPYAMHVVDITQGEQNQPQFLKISPNNEIPAIVDAHGPAGEPVSVFESGAILVYLTEKSGRFLPQGLLRRIAAFARLMFQMGGFGPLPGQVHHFIALPDEDDKRYGLSGLGLAP